MLKHKNILKGKLRGPVYYECCSSLRILRQRLVDFWNKAFKPLHKLKANLFLTLSKQILNFSIRLPIFQNPSRALPSRSHLSCSLQAVAKDLFFYLPFLFFRFPDSGLLQEVTEQVVAVLSFGETTDLHSVWSFCISRFYLPGLVYKAKATFFHRSHSLLSIAAILAAPECKDDTLGRNTISEHR